MTSLCKYVNFNQFELVVSLRRFTATQRRRAL